MEKSKAEEKLLDEELGAENPLDSALANSPKSKTRRKTRKTGKSDALVEENVPDIVVNKTKAEMRKWKFRVQPMRREKLENAEPGEIGPLMFRAADFRTNDESEAIKEYCNLYRLNVTRNQFVVQCQEKDKRFQASCESKRLKMIARGYDEKKIEETIRIMAS